MVATWTSEYGVVVLADDSLPRGPGSLSLLDAWPEHQQAVQSVGFARYRNLEHFSRLNIGITYHLRVRAEFNSISECGTFRDDALDAVRGNGSLELEYDDGSIRTLEGAVCVAVRFPERIGVTTIAEYEFRGRTLS